MTKVCIALEVHQVNTIIDALYTADRYYSLAVDHFTKAPDGKHNADHATERVAAIRGVISALDKAGRKAGLVDDAIN